MNPLIKIFLPPLIKKAPLTAIYKQLKEILRAKTPNFEDIFTNRQAPCRTKVYDPRHEFFYDPSPTRAPRAHVLHISIHT